MSVLSIQEFKNFNDLNDFKQFKISSFIDKNAVTRVAGSQTRS